MTRDCWKCNGEAQSDKMHIREYQDWLEKYDARRGWDRVAPSQTLVHAVEEMGEVARLVLYLEGYREPEDEVELKQQLQGELADCVTFLYKVAYQYGLDMEQGLIDNITKAETRYPVDEGRREMDRYLERQRVNIQRLQGAVDEQAPSKARDELDG